MSDGRELADAMEAERDLARGNMIAAERERDEYAARAEAAEALAAEYGAKWQAAVERAEKAEAEEKDSDAVRAKLADLLTAVADAVNGPPGPLRRWGWADLPDKVRALAAEAERLRVMSCAQEAEVERLRAKFEALRDRKAPEIAAAMDEAAFRRAEAEAAEVEQLRAKLDEARAWARTPSPHFLTDPEMVGERFVAGYRAAQHAIATLVGRSAQSMQPALAPGIAPGADAWHVAASGLRAKFWELFRQREDWRGRAQAAEAEVERLRAKLDAAREARQRLFLGGTSGLIAGVARMGLRDLDAALAPDAKAQSEPIADQSAAQSPDKPTGYRAARGALPPCNEPSEVTIRRGRGDDDLDARLRRLRQRRGGVQMQSVGPSQWRVVVYTPGDQRHDQDGYGPTPTAAVAALEAAMEGDRE